MNKKDQLILKMIEHDDGNPWMIQHFIKVHEFARIIGTLEKLEEYQMEILEAASIVHDIGIKISKEKHGKSNGKLQEKEGPPYAEKMLGSLGYNKESIERVSYLVAHHHTYTDIDGIDYQILIEADFLVNFYEENIDSEAVKNTYNKIFRTESGKMLCRKIFGF
jgi:HD superfamily phosphodiesterase